MNRTPIVAGNWKMNLGIGEAIDLAAGVKRGMADAEIERVEVVLCPPFTALKSVGDLVRYSSVGLGAQNMHWESRGAYTGEVSAEMLKDLGCKYVILGHSERRQYFGETDELVNKKARVALAAGLSVIVCVGETLEERQAGHAEAVVGTQVAGCLKDLGEGLLRTVIAYEPVWAIGTGETATPDEAQAAHSFIRRCVRESDGDAKASGIRIQYGGSVKADNAADLFNQPDVDGGLIGGASLDPDSFVRIVAAAAEAP